AEGIQFLDQLRPGMSTGAAQLQEARSEACHTDVVSFLGTTRMKSEHDQRERQVRLRHVGNGKSVRKGLARDGRKARRGDQRRGGWLLELLRFFGHWSSSRALLLVRGGMLAVSTGGGAARQGQ